MGLSSAFSSQVFQLERPLGAVLVVPTMRRKFSPNKVETILCDRVADFGLFFDGLRSTARGFSFGGCRSRRWPGRSQLRSFG